jgi:hypothetical protein
VISNQNQIYNTLQGFNASFANLSSQVQRKTQGTNPRTFSNISTKLASIDSRVANMQPQVITQSISFLVGAFIAIAFIIASKMRF